MYWTICLLKYLVFLAPHVLTLNENKYSSLNPSPSLRSFRYSRETHASQAQEKSIEISLSPSSNTTTSLNTSKNVPFSSTSKPSSTTTKYPTGIMYINQKPPASNYDNSTDVDLNLNGDSSESEDNRDRDTSNITESASSPKLDDKAVQRALFVIGVLCAMIGIYFIIKFVYMKKKKVSRKRYGRIDSEVDLLEDIQEDETEEEDDTLFDINTLRRGSQY